MRSPEDSLTVSELNHFIRDVLSSGFPQAVWICGEVQELRDKKHLYFTLSEKDPDSNAIVAKIGATIWANARPKIEAILQKAENSFVLKDDIEVKLLCKVDFYPPFGQVRLIVEAIDPTYTLGKIAQDRQRLIALLKSKGIFEKNKQLEMPRVPLSIGLITSDHSAAYHDFIDELKKSGLAFYVNLVDSLMQGKSAEKSVAAAIKLLNQRNDVDVIVITRGGGSIAELSCFDSQMIAEAIALSKVPVLSGIGHEINTTVTDLTAHAFAKTPTAVARLLIGRVVEFVDYLEEKKEFLFRLAKEGLEDQRRGVKNQALSLQKSISGLIKMQQGMVTRSTEVFRRLPMSMLRQVKTERLMKVESLKKTIQLRLQESKAKIQTYHKLIDVADPKNVLKKGFSITRDEKGKVLKSVKSIKNSVIIHSHLLDGIVISDVKDVKKGSYGL